jgi:hypothetical protein
MDGLLLFVTVVVALAVFAATAIVFGVDSRDGFADPRAPIRPTGIS